MTPTLRTTTATAPRWTHDRRGPPAVAALACFAAAASTGAAAADAAWDPVRVVATAVAFGLVLRATMPARPAAAVAVAAGLAAIAASFTSTLTPTLAPHHLQPAAAATAVALACSAVTALAATRRRTCGRYPGLAQAVLVAGVVIVTMFWSRASSSVTGLPVEQVPVDVAVLAVGAAVVIARWQVAVVAAFAILAVPAGEIVALAFVDGPALQSLTGYALVTVPVVAASAAAASVVAAPAGRRSALRLLITVNSLNVVDAVFTWWLLSRGSGGELNPVIDVIGLPGKVVLVAAGSWVVYRIQPAALRVAVVVLSTVVLYHAMGAVTAGT